MRWFVRVVVVLAALGGVGYYAARTSVRRMFPPADPVRIAALKMSGRTLIEAIEAHRRSHGRYPDDLIAMGAASKMAAREGWTYRKLDDEKGFVLRVGDYQKDHFVLDWMSDYGDWTTDQ